MTVLGNDRGRRAVALVLIIAALTGLFVGFGSLTDDPGDPYPDDGVMIEHWDAFVGERGTIAGIVVGTEPVAIRVTAAGRDRVVRVSGLLVPVAPGDTLSVSGTVRPDYRITATAAVVHRSGNRLYMYGISIAALGLVAGLGVRYWTVDRDDWALRPREGMDA